MSLLDYDTFETFSATFKPVMLKDPATGRRNKKSPSELFDEFEQLIEKKTELIHTTASEMRDHANDLMEEAGRLEEEAQQLIMKLKSHYGIES